MRLPCAAGADGVRKCRGDRMLRIWGPKGTGRFQIEPEAAGPGKTAPGLEPEASLEVPSAEPFTPYLIAISFRSGFCARSLFPSSRLEIPSGMTMSVISKLMSCTLGHHTSIASRAEAASCTL